MRGESVQEKICRGRQVLTMSVRILIEKMSAKSCGRGGMVQDMAVKEERLIAEIHGGDIYRSKSVVTDFSVNVNPLGAPPEVTAAVRAAAGEICRYPDMHCGRLTEAVGEFERVPAEYIICGNGAAELIFAAVLAVRPKKALVLSPTFSEYERALRAVGAKVNYYELNETENFRVTEDFLDAVTPKTDMVFLCNPNNPTGQSIPKGLVEWVAEMCSRQGSFLVIDECFVDFLEDSEKAQMKDRLDDFPGMLIVKALTKLFAMPGLRLGYGMCSDRKFLGRMRDTLQSWNVSVPAQAGGVAALENCGAYLAETKRVIRREREYLAGQLKELGYKVYGSEANYIFFRDFRAKERDLFAMALSAGFLLRDCSSYRGLCRGYYRIAVRMRKENERMVAWLRQL